MVVEVDEAEEEWIEVDEVVVEEAELEVHHAGVDDNVFLPQAVHWQCVRVKSCKHRFGWSRPCFKRQLCSNIDTFQKAATLSRTNSFQLQNSIYQYVVLRRYLSASSVLYLYVTT